MFFVVFSLFVLCVSLSFRSYKIYQRHTKKTKQTSILILVFFSLFLLSMSGGVLVQYCFYVTVRLSWWQLPLSCNPAPVVVVSLAVVACACPVSFLRLDVFSCRFFFSVSLKRSNLSSCSRHASRTGNPVAKFSGLLSSMFS